MLQASDTIKKLPTASSGAFCCSLFRPVAVQVYKDLLSGEEFFSDAKTIEEVRPLCCSVQSARFFAAAP